MIADRLRASSFAFTLAVCCCVGALLAAGPAQAQTGSFPSGAINLGTVAVNTGAPSQATLVFTFATGGTIAAPAVVTQGAPNLDFTDAGTGTCTTNGTSHVYNANDTCTVVVKFAPRVSGPIYGAVVLYGSSGTPIATGYIHGTGTAPQIVFSPATQSTVPVSNGRAEVALAVDESGDLYLNTTIGLVKESPSEGGYVESPVADVDGTWGMAVDGAGNVYASNGGSEVVKETLLSAGYAESPVATSTSYNPYGWTPTGLAVDAAGDVYVVDDLGGAVVKETPSGSTYTESLVMYGPSPGWALAVDGSGDLFETCVLDNVLYKDTPAAGSYTESTFGSGLRDNSPYSFGPFGVAVDGVGDVYATDNAHGSIVEERPEGSVYLQSKLAGGFNTPYGIGVDGAGNIYFTNAGSQPVKLDVIDPPSLSFAATGETETSTDSPHTVLLHNIGNKPMSFSSISFPPDFSEASGAPRDCTPAKALPAGATCTLTINFSPLPESLSGLSTALTEVVTVTDNNLNGTGVVQSIAVSGSVMGPTQLAFATAPAPMIAVGGNAGSGIVVDAEFANGTVATPSSPSIALTVTYPDATLRTYTQTAVNGVASFDLSGASLTETGAYSYAASSVGLTSAGATEIVVAPNLTTPPTPLGSASAVQTATMMSSAGFTLGSIAVLTQGAPNQDFQAAAGGTCSVGASYSAGQTCTVNYTFNPRYAGTRHGAVVLYDNASPANAVATAYMQGTGDGQQVALNSSSQTVLGGGFGWLYGVAVDGDGNVYTADFPNSAVKIVPAGCVSSACVTTIGAGIPGPYGLAIDAAGNAYVIEFYDNLVAEIPSGCVSSGCVKLLGGGFGHPLGVAVDGGGNIYVADQGSHAVKVMSPGCGATSCVATLSTNFNGPTGVAVASNGTVYVADGNAVYAIPAGCATASCFTQVGGGFGGATSVAVDGGGNIYVSDGTLREMPAGCTDTSCVTAVIPSIGGPVAIDGAGNLYTGSNELIEVNRQQPRVTFARTLGGAISQDSPQTIVVQNIGTEPLTFPIPASGNNPSLTNDNFILGSSGNDACAVIGSGSESAGMLAPGANCALTISFAPGNAAFGNVSGSLLFIDNTLNATAPAYATQTIALSGVANPPLGAIAQPIDAATRSNFVLQSHNILFSGWAADPHDGAPVSQVTVLIDGTAVGKAKLGIARADVVAAFNNYSYYRSGWALTYPAAGLELRKHQVTALITDSLGVTTQARAQTFWVVNFINYGSPFGAMDTLIDATTRSTTVATGDNLLVTGWAADPHDGAPVSSVSIAIDGATVGTATLGIARPDVAAVLKKPADLNSGWSFTMAATGLSLGTHTVSATAGDSLGLSSTLGKQTITVAASSSDGPPFGSLGSAVDATTGLTTVSQKDKLLVEGWAADVHDGAPVSQVSILIDGTAAGNAKLGLAQRNVGMNLGSRYTNAGWTFTMPASSLSLGAHSVTAVATDSLGLSTRFQIVPVTVKP